MIKILLISIILIILLFFVILFLIGLLRVKDWKLSLTIMFFETMIPLKATKNERIEERARLISDSLRENMKKIVKKKDEELMNQFSIDKNQVRKLKESAEEVLKEKDCLFISIEDTRILMESNDELSYLGSYKKSLDLFSDKTIRDEYIKMVNNRKQKRDTYQEIEERYNEKIFRDSQKDLVKSFENEAVWQLC